MRTRKFWGLMTALLLLPIQGGPVHAQAPAGIWVALPSVRSESGGEFVDSESLDAAQASSSVSAKGLPSPVTASTTGCRNMAETRRSGYPMCISRFARPSYNAKGYSGGYVGGGASVLIGECRFPHEGTWGVDYDGWLLPKKVWKRWSHGRRYQGGTGAYKTDGPHLHLTHEPVSAE